MHSAAFFFVHVVKVNLCRYDMLIPKKLHYHRDSNNKRRHNVASLYSKWRISIPIEIQ